jgi:hypothetical protein
MRAIYILCWLCLRRSHDRTPKFACVSDDALLPGFEGLYGLGRDELGCDPLSGHLFLFANSCRTRLKVLVFDGSSLWVCSKRLPPQRLRPVAGDPGLPPQRLRPVAGDPGLRKGAFGGRMRQAPNESRCGRKS